MKHDLIYKDWRWCWRFDEEKGETDCGVVSEDGISVCRAPRYVTREEWEKTAPLIAAAPKMLKRLRMTRAVLAQALGLIEEDVFDIIGKRSEEDGQT